MPRIHRHRDHSILIFEEPLERMEVPAEGSYVVCRFGGGFGGFWLDAHEFVALSGPTPLPTIEDALRPVLGSLDQLWEVEERDRVEQFEAAVGQAAMPAPLPEDALFWNGERSPVQLPLGVVLQLLNALAPADPARLEALNAFKRSSEAVVAGIVLKPDGNLAFDTQRYSLAIYRRKQKRRAEAAMEQLKKAVQDIAMVNDFLDLEHRAADVNELSVGGQPLIALPDSPSNAFTAVNKALPQVLAGALNVQHRLEAATAPTQLPPDASPK
ncbi:MAG: hypothetical protein IPK34_09390 [Ramlibacter sp.]|jgi:hypothetical protein|nr:hypothetical protein [Ramlibacter sp.]